MQAAKGLWIPLASLMLWIYEFHGVSDSPEYQMQDLGFTSLLTEIKNFSLHILSRMTGVGKTADLLLILLFLAAGIWLGIKKKNFFPAIVAAGTFLFEALFSVLVYQLHIWHYIAIVFAVIWCFWILLDTDGESAGQAGGTKEAARILPEIFLIIISILMLVQWNSAEESSSLQNALSGVYSDGVNAASYIRENVPEDSLIISTDVSEAIHSDRLSWEEISVLLCGKWKNRNLCRLYRGTEGQGLNMRIFWTGQVLISQIRKAFIF